VGWGGEACMEGPHHTYRYRLGSKEAVDEGGGCGGERDAGSDRSEPCSNGAITQ
jgi:hypothetical protein